MPIVIVRHTRKYGLSNFIGDVLLTGITGGFWLLWVFVRELRNR